MRVVAVMSLPSSLDQVRMPNKKTAAKPLILIFPFTPPVETPTVSRLERIDVLMAFAAIINIWGSFPVTFNSSQTPSL